MKATDKLYPQDVLIELSQYIDNKTVDILSFLDNLQSYIQQVNNNYVILRDDITSLSNSIPQDVITILSNFGDEFVFKQGITDKLLNTIDQNKTEFLYKLGLYVGEYILKSIETLQKRLYDDIIIVVDKQDNFQSLQEGLTEAGKYSKPTIKITFNDIDSYQYQFTFSNRDYLTVQSKYRDYTISVTNFHNDKPKFYLENIKKVTFKNLTIVNSVPILPTDLPNIINSLFIVDNVTLEFIDCTFVDNTGLDSYLIYSKNSNIIFRNCTFEKDSNSNLYLVNSHMKYPNNVYVIGTDITTLPSNISFVNSSDKLQTFNWVA